MQHVNLQHNTSPMIERQWPGNPSQASDIKQKFRSESSNTRCPWTKLLNYRRNNTLWYIWHCLQLCTL